MLEEKWWKNGAHSVIFDGIIERLNDQGKYKQRPEWSEGIRPEGHLEEEVGG